MPRLRDTIARITPNRTIVPTAPASEPRAVGPVPAQALQRRLAPSGQQAQPPRPTAMRTVVEQRPAAVGFAGSGGGASLPPTSISRQQMRGALRGGSTKARVKRLHAALMKLSDGMPEPPSEFDPGVQYRVRLNRSVEVPNTGIWLRPMSDVIVRGDFAATIADAIATARAL